jgi:hypothetical protein
MFPPEHPVAISPETLLRLGSKLSCNIAPDLPKYLSEDANQRSQNKKEKRQYEKSNDGL